jgi:hypothetical protein
VTNVQLLCRILRAKGLQLSTFDGRFCLTDGRLGPALTSLWAVALVKEALVIALALGALHRVLQSAVLEVEFGGGTLVGDLGAERATDLGDAYAAAGRTGGSDFSAGGHSVLDDVDVSTVDATVEVA